MTDDEKPSEKLYLVIGMAEQEEQEIMKVCLTKKEAISYAKRNLTDYEGVPIGESDATDMSNCIQEIEIPHKALLSAALDALKEEQRYWGSRPSSDNLEIAGREYKRITQKIERLKGM